MNVERFIENGGNPEINDKLFEKLAPRPVLDSPSEDVRDERYVGQSVSLIAAREAVEEAYQNIELSNN